LTREGGDALGVAAGRTAFCVLALVVGLLAPVVAKACPGQFIFSDNFTTMDPAWGKPDVAAFVTPNHAFGLAATSDKTNGRLYTKNAFGDVDICVNMFVSMTASADDIGGLVFWASDDNNYYFLAITGDGRYAVLRDSGGKWSTAVALTKTNALVPGKTKANTLQIGLVGNEATITINGQQVGSFKGAPPANGGYIGLRVAAGARGVTAWGFFNLSVTDPTQPASGSAASGSTAPKTLPPPALAALPTPTSAPPAPTVNTCTGQPVYADNFQSFDASAWGPIDNMSLTVNSGQGAALILATNGGGANIRFNTRSFAQNIDVCVSLSLAANGNTVNGGGLIFWASDNKNYYALMITGAGTFSVFQQNNGQWTIPTPWTKSNALKTGVNVYNELQVNLAGNNATIVINGQQVTSVAAQPSPTANYLGLISEAGPNKGVAWMFAQFSVTNPGSAAASDGGGAGLTPASAPRGGGR
jgi:hypothetical protein